MKRAFVAVAMVLFAAAGCGGVENEPNLAKAVERTEATGSSRIELRMPLVEDGGRVDVRCEGTADFRFTCSYGLGEILEVGDTQYVTSEAFGVRGDKRWVKLPVDENDSLSQLSPVRVLSMLRDASLETVRIG